MSDWISRILRLRFLLVLELVIYKVIFHIVEKILKGLNDTMPHINLKISLTL